MNKPTTACRSAALLLALLLVLLTLLSACGADNSTEQVQ